MQGDDLEFSVDGNLILKPIDAEDCKLTSEYGFSFPHIDLEAIRRGVNEQLAKISRDGVRYECRSATLSDDKKSVILDIVEIPTVTFTVPLD